MTPRARILDISPHQGGRIDWAAVRGAGIACVILRAFEGQTPDEHPGGYSFERLRREALDAGLVVGSYQYLRARHDGTRLAELYLDQLGDLDPCELPPCLDVEELDGQSPGRVRDVVGAWIAVMTARLGHSPLLYTGPFFWQSILAGEQCPEARHCPLWLADYRSEERIHVPAPWEAWTAWQETGEGRCPGVPGPVDLGVWRGDEADLRDFARERCRPPW